MRKRWIAVGAGVVVVGAGVWFVAQIGPRNIIGMIRYDQRRDGDLRVGDAAPDVALSALDGGGPVQLLGRPRRPLVIVFGSFT